MSAALLVGAAVVAYLASRRGDSSPTPPSPYNPFPFSPPMPDNSNATGAAVFDRENARGVHPSLQQLLDDWTREGWFDIRVASGVRTQAEQTANFVAKLTNASDVSTTPHGRGAALDIHPVGFNEHACYNVQPGMLQRMNEFGAWAKTKGFAWGGDWSGIYSQACWPVDQVRGDRPHVEIRNWQSLPFPPPAYFSPV